jgi:hypothetical protein
VTQEYYNIIILWDHRRIRGSFLTEKSLYGAYRYCASQNSLFTECVWCACTNVKKSDTEFFVLLCLYRNSQYINIRALTDCRDCVTVWMTLTLRGLRCKFRQLSDIISITESSFYRIFERRYVEVRTKILQETEILTICQFIRKIVHIRWEDQGNDWLYIGISEFI